LAVPNTKLPVGRQPSLMLVRGSAASMVISTCACNGRLACHALRQLRHAEALAQSQQHAARVHMAITQALSSMRSGRAQWRAAASVYSWPADRIEPAPAPRRRVPAQRRRTWPPGSTGGRGGDDGGATGNSYGSCNGG
jgi:hypothetical protein